MDLQNSKWIINNTQKQRNLQTTTTTKKKNILMENIIVSNIFFFILSWHEILKCYFSSNNHNYSILIFNLLNKIEPIPLSFFFFLTEVRKSSVHCNYMDNLKKVLDHLVCDLHNEQILLNSLNSNNNEILS